MQKAANTPWKYGNDQIILKAKRCGRDLLTLLTKTQHQMEEKKGSHGKSYYFGRRFTQIRTPNVDDPQFEYKCKRSVLYEFNRTLTSDGLGSISVGTMFNWMKKYRPYVGICPSMSDYCDTCKEKNEDIFGPFSAFVRAKRTLNRPAIRTIRASLHSNFRAAKLGRNRGRYHITLVERYDRNIKHQRNL